MKLQFDAGIWKLGGEKVNRKNEHERTQFAEKSQPKC